MIASTSTPFDFLQNRLESISMRLDAAADSLLQTRDMFIRQIEQQMLQIQDVRTALHEAAVETQQKTPAPVAGPVKPVGELTLESLFSPLNAVPRAPAASYVDIEIAEPEDHANEAKAAGASLFEVEPAREWEAPVQGPEAPAAATMLAPKAATAGALNARGSDMIDPDLEKATLDELNEALTRAFAQIARRSASV